MNTSRVVACILCTIWVSTVSAAPGKTSSLEEDFQRLQGKWVSVSPDRYWEINFGTAGVQMAHGGEDAKFAASGVAVFKVQEDSKGRYFEMNSVSLPPRIYYHFDQDKLVLDLGEKWPTDPPVFTRYSPSSTPWIIGAVLPRDHPGQRSNWFATIADETEVEPHRPEYGDTESPRELA